MPRLVEAVWFLHLEMLTTTFSIANVHKLQPGTLVSMDSVVCLSDLKQLLPLWLHSIDI